MPHPLPAPVTDPLPTPPESLALHPLPDPLPQQQQPQPQPQPAQTAPVAVRAADTNPADGALASPWAGFWHRGLRNLAVSAVIALMIWLISSGQRGNLYSAWVYSTAIGAFCWLFIDAGRLLLASRLPLRFLPNGRRRHRWPGPGWMLVCILVGAGLGYTLGSAVGDSITGFVTPSLVQNRAAILLTLICGIAATWYFYATERLRLEQAAAEAARREAAEAQLMLLQSQLEPHMLFNTLANLRVLITLDPPRAQAMLDRLIGYLRATLGATLGATPGPSVGHGRGLLHPLSAEFERLDDYLALMALRMGPRLQVVLDLPTDLRALPVPPLLLQPLVENSIRHGLEPKVAGGRIEVRAQQVGARLRLTVRDTGVGLADDPAQAQAQAQAQARTQTQAPDADPSSHYGTRHVAARLTTMYGGQAHFSLSAAGGDEGGTLAEVDLPMPTPQTPV